MRQSNISNFSYFYQIACLPDLCLSLISTFPNHWFILSVNSINHLTFPPSIFMHNFLDNILSGLYVHSVISNEVVYFVMNLFATCMTLPPPSPSLSGSQCFLCKKKHWDFGSNMLFGKHFEKKLFTCFTIVVTKTCQL